MAAPYEEIPGPASSAAIRRDGVGRVRARVDAWLERAGVGMTLDVMPRVISADEWHDLKIGLAQRVKALNAFVADAYGQRRIVQAGVVPPHVIEGAARYEPEMRRVSPVGGVWIGIAAMDVLRGEAGEFLVLEDNLTTPSGFGYAVAAREAVLPALDVAASDRPRSFAEVPALLAGTLAAACGVDDPYAVVLTDGGASWEHEWAARVISAPLVQVGDVRVDGDRLMHGDRAVDVVYRRTDADAVESLVGALLAGPVRAGSLAVVNAFGCGVGDDRLTHTYVEDMVRFYLGEEPAIRSVATYDLARPDHLEIALDRFDSLVVKPRAGEGGAVVCPAAEPAEVEALREKVRAAPRDWVAQPFMVRSTHPTLVGDSMARLPVELRPFVFMHGPDHPRVLPGGLTRFDGGVKDTWVLD